MATQMKLRILIVLAALITCSFASEDIKCQNLEDCRIKFENYINENLGKIHFLEMIYNDEVNEIYKTHGYGMFYQRKIKLNIFQKLKNPHCIQSKNMFCPKYLIIGLTSIIIIKKKNQIII